MPDGPSESPESMTPPESAHPDQSSASAGPTLAQGRRACRGAGNSTTPSCSRHSTTAARPAPPRRAVLLDQAQPRPLKPDLFTISRLKPSRLKPSRLKPSRLKPSRLKPSRLKPSRLKRSRLEAQPAEARSEDARPAETRPAEAEPVHARPPAGGEDQDAVLDEILAGQGRVLSAAEVTGRVAEFLPPGPGLAGWLAAAPAAALDDGALGGVAASWRRLASWAQAGELAAVSQVAARAAARDPDIGIEADGRPARVGADATAEVCLALVMSQCGASWWADLAVTLAWRLARTGDALRGGVIDLSRARLIAEATSVLDDDAARLVEGEVLARAGDQTLGQLRAALRRAVIIADPDGAERRREEAERRARVCLYPDEEGTATLAGHSLPGIHAAAAMARVTALARAVRASGAGGGIDLLRAQVFTGLLLGTLPYIPPAPGSPPDEPPDDDGGIDPHPPAPRTPAHRATGHGPAGRGPAGGGPAGQAPAGGGPAGHGPAGGGPAGQAPAGGGPAGRGGAGQDGAAPRRPPPGSGSAGRAGGRAIQPAPVTAAQPARARGSRFQRRRSGTSPSRPAARRSSGSWS